MPTLLKSWQPFWKDVGDASLLLDEAVIVLKDNSQAAAEYLALQGTQDAAEILRELTLRYHLEASWIWPHMTLDTDAGQLVVHSVRDRDTGQLRYCASISYNCYADGILHLPHSDLSVRLDVRNRLLHFNTRNPFQCQYCRQLFSDISSYTHHHESMHIGQPQARRRLKQDLGLAWIRPLLVDERAEERL